jgi:hypothetical protein
MSKYHILFLITFLYTQFSFGQNSFNVIYDVEDGFHNKIRGMDLDQEGNIIISSAQFCFNDSLYNECSVLTKFNDEGELLAQILLDSIYSARDNSLQVMGNRIFLAGHLHEPFFGRTNRLFEFDSTFNLLENNGYNSFNDRVPNLLEHSIIDGFLYQTGNLIDYNNELVFGQITKIDLESNVSSWENIYLSPTFTIDINNLQLNPDGNLNCIIFHRPEVGDQSQRPGFKIMKIDLKGEVLDTFEFEDLNDQKSRLLVDSNGSYYFSSKRSPIDYFDTSNGRINKLNENMDSIEWSFKLPFDSVINGRQYHINEYLETNNGEIIACGKVRDTSDSVSNQINTTDNGFIIRFTPDGEILSLKIYKFPNVKYSSDDGLFQNSTIKKIKELDRGDLIVSGEVYLTTSQIVNNDVIETENEYFDLFLMRVDEEGCLENTECNEIIYINHSIGSDTCSYLKNNASWYYSPHSFTSQNEIQNIAVIGDTLIGNRHCSVLGIIEDDSIISNSELILFNSDTIVEFYENGEFKILFNFSSELMVGDTVDYFLPEQFNVYDISSGSGANAISSDTLKFLINDIASVITNNGEELRTFITSPVFDEENMCHDINEIIEGIGSIRGFMGRNCTQLGSGFPEFFRCFESLNINYSALSGECILSSSNTVDNIDIEIFPNPASTQLHIKVLDNNRLEIIEIIDSHGRQVEAIQSQLSTNQTKVINIDKLNYGTYFLRLRSEGGTYVKKFVII